MNRAEQEARRLQDLYRLGILDSDPEQAYDEVTRLAAGICETPIALISLVDKDRQWFKSIIGLDFGETDRDISFCSHALWTADLFEVPDARTDPRFSGNELVLGPAGIRSYAGAVVFGPEQMPVGTVCVLDVVPRELSEKQREMLRFLGRQVSRIFELRLKNKQLHEQSLERLQSIEGQHRLMTVIAHDLRSPLIAQAGLCDLLELAVQKGDHEAIEKRLNALRRSTKSSDQLLENLLTWGLQDTPAMQARLERIDMGTALSEIRAFHHASAEAKGLCLELSCEHGLTVTSDRNMLRSILMNLMNNAIKFSDRGQRISIEATGAGSNGTLIAVSDEGLGISADQLSALKQQACLISSTTGTDGERGSGLGLRLCHALAHRCNATLQARSTLGVGTVMVLCLPPPETTSTEQ